MKIIIVGGVAGGASAAARLRRLNEKAQITIYEKTSYISYANCGLPYYVGGVIENKNSLTLQTPSSFYSRFNIIAKTNHEVIDINTDKKTVIVKNLQTNERFIDNYDKLVLSPGAIPVLPSFYIESNKIFTLKTVEDSYKIKEFIEITKPKSAVVIGGGFIGVEIAENLSLLGLKVSIIEYEKHLLKNLDRDMASFVHATLRANGIKLYIDTKVESIIEKDNLIVKTNKERVEADIIILAAGIKPQTELAKKANLTLGRKESIVVNENMQTSNPDIYAVGDAVQINNFITNEKELISLAGPANKQGRIAADSICGKTSTYHGSLLTSILKVFDLAVASVGLNEKACHNLPYEKVILSPASHATYYPGSKALTLKVIYNRETQEILGAQVVGYDGVDKQIDVIATAMYAKLKATQLKDLDLAYAPPFSSAKSPVNMAGYIIDNIENGLVKQFHYNEINNLRQQNVILLDTRTSFEYLRGHTEGFINIPLDELRERLNELDKNKKIYVMCQSGLRSYLATRILVQYGYDAYNFSGGYRLYNSIYNDEVLNKECYPCGLDK